MIRRRPPASGAQTGPRDASRPFQGDDLVAHSGLIELHLRTATSKVKIEIYGKELVDSVREALFACAESLRAMQRPVELNSRLQRARE